MEKNISYQNAYRDFYQTQYVPSADRYETMLYRRCGKSGLQMSLLSLGYWQNFGDENTYQSAKELTLHAFDRGITVFDLANNYGRPTVGAAEINFGRILKESLAPYRREIVITTKAGYNMWPGPYGDMGSRKYLMASVDTSLKNLGVDYIDIFYHHREDPETPLEETMGALADMVRQGKVLYIGLSNYSPERTKKAAAILEDLGIHCLVHQPRFNMLDQEVKQNGLFQVLEEAGMGAAVYSPLAQGLLSGKYNNGVPKESRAAGPSIYFTQDNLKPELLEKVRKLSAISERRGQTMPQLALSWILSHPVIASVIIGASRVSQIDDNIDALKNLSFSEEELREIDQILA